MTNNEMLNMYTKLLKASKKADNTIKRYEINVKDFMRYCDDNGIEILKVKRLNVKLYLSSLNLSSATFNNILSALKSFYKFLVLDLELIEFNPVESIEGIKVENHVKKPLSDEQVFALLDNSKNIRDKAIIFSLVSVGFRISELIDLKLSQYENRDSNNMITFRGKGKKERAIFFNPKAVELIDEYLKVRKGGIDNLFVSNQGSPMDRISVSRMLKVTARRTEKFNEEQIANLCNHLLRATCATHMGQENVPIQVIQQVLGHSSIEVTRRYVKNSEQQIYQAMSQNYM